MNILNEEQVEKFKSLWLNPEKSLCAIAKEMNMSRKTLPFIAENYGLGKREVVNPYARRYKLDIDQVKELWNDPNLTKADVARRLGMSPAGIGDYAIKNKLGPKAVKPRILEASFNKKTSIKSDRKDLGSVFSMATIRAHRREKPSFFRLPIGEEISLFDIGHGRCRHLTPSFQSRDNPICCGKRTADGYSYCQEHRAMYYTNSENRHLKFLEWSEKTKKIRTA